MNLGKFRTQWHANVRTEEIEELLLAAAQMHPVLEHSK
jgi:hypothetical protein